MNFTCRLCLVLGAGILLPLSVSAKTRKELREEARRDSIRVADSVRTASSKRGADSGSLDSYNQYAAQKEKDRIARAGQTSSPPPDTTSSGAVSGKREIVIPPGSEQERIVDSLDKEIARVESVLYADRHFKKAKAYTSEGKLKYLKALLKAGTRSSSDISGLAEKLLLTHTLERQKLINILQTQEGNNRSLLMAHIKKLDSENAPLSDFVARLALTEKPGVGR